MPCSWQSQGSRQERDRSCRGLFAIIDGWLLPFATLDRFNVRLERLQDGGGWIPIVAVDVAERVAVQTGPLSHAASGHPALFQCGAHPFNEVGNHASDKSILRYARQEPFHTAICNLKRSYRRMERTPDERR